ncbi:MAG: M48 family metalloprotease [Bryobacterales bacterium]|nr:M48 family metalloprotease [Bryobacterales bacterium]
MRYKLQGRLRYRWLPALLAVLALAGCAARHPGDPIKPGFNMYSKEQDIELGRQAAAEVRKQVQVVQNPELQNYIGAIGKKLAAQPEAGGYPYSFTLINEPSINAFALPGGPIFVNTGLIEAADNEAQVAGVLAHEIAHVALRHGTNQASKASLIQLPAVLAGMAIGQDSVVDQIAQLGLGFGVNSVILKYSRDAENQADALGTRILAEAGYNPIEMANFFEKLQEEGGSRPPQFLSSHPDPGNRVSRVQAEIQALPASIPRDFHASVGNFAHEKRLVAQLPKPRSREQTAERREAPTESPSGAMQTLRARTFEVARPAGWQAFGDQSSSTVTVAPSQGLVQTRTGASLGYGVVMSYYQPRDARNLEQATGELVSQLAGLDRSIQSRGNQRRVTVSGNPGLVTTLYGQSPYGGAERLMLLTVPRPEGLFYMVFVAPDSRFEQLSAPFEQMVNSLTFRS